MSIVKRDGLGRPMTWGELDGNFDAVESLRTEAAQSVAQSQANANAAAASSAVAEQARDDAQAAAEQVEADLERVIKAPTGETLTQLPVAASRTDTLMGFDEHGQPVVYPVSRFDEVNVSELWSRSLAEAGYNFLGFYAAGITFTSKLDVIVHDGVAFKLNDSTDVGFVTTGFFTVDVNSFRQMGNGDVLRRELASPPGGKLVALEQGGTVQDAITWVTPQMFVRPTDEVFDPDPMKNDWIDILERAIKECVVWEWKGTPQLTDNAVVVKHKLSLLPGTTYRITRPLLIPPGLVMVGDCPMSFYNFGGSVILADFEDKTKYALDTANYDINGVRQVGVDRYRKESSDNRLVSRAVGIVLKNFMVQSKTENVIKGAINLALAHNAETSGLGTRGFACGLNITCSWNGFTRDSTLRGSSAGVTLRTDVTHWDVSNNYLTCVGSGATSNPNEWFDYPDFPDATIKGMTAGICGDWASPRLRGNYIEHNQIGVRLKDAIGAEDTGNTYEQNNDYLYTLFNSRMEMSPSYFFQRSDQNCKFAWVNGGIVHRPTINMANCAYFAGGYSALTVSQYLSVMVKNNHGTYLTTQYENPKRVQYETYSVEPGFCDVYLSSGGNDDNQGHSIGNAVKTLQEALDRCKPNLRNRIYVTAGETIATKQYYRDETHNWNKVFEGYTIEIIGNATNHPRIVFTGGTQQLFSASFSNSSIIFKNIDLYADYTLADSNRGYRGLIGAKGVVDITFDACSVSSKDSTNLARVVGSGFNWSAIVSINFIGCAVKDMVIADTALSSNSQVMWMMNYTSTTFSNVTDGDTTLKVMSRSM